MCMCRIPLNELLDQCVLPTLSQTLHTMIPLVTLCVAARLTFAVFGGASLPPTLSDTPWLLGRTHGGATVFLPPKPPRMSPHSQNKEKRHRPGKLFSRRHVRRMGARTH